MNTNALFQRDGRGGALLFFTICLCTMIAAVIAAWLVQRDFGRVEVSNVTYENYNGIPIRAKLLRPVHASRENRMPGAVYIH